MSRVRAFRLRHHPFPAFPRLTHVGFAKGYMNLGRHFHAHLGHEFFLFLRAGEVDLGPSGRVHVRSGDFLAIQGGVKHRFLHPKPLDYLWFGIQLDARVRHAHFGQDSTTVAEDPARSLLPDGRAIPPSPVDREIPRAFAESLQVDLSLQSVGAGLANCGALRLEGMTALRPLFHGLLDEVEGGRPWAAAVAHAKIQEILALIARRRASGEAIAPVDPLEAVDAWMQEHFTETIRLSTLAERVGCHPATLIRRFQAAKGISPMARLTRIRLDHAAEVLRRGRSVAEAAQASGFSDPFHFSRVFRREKGVSPSSYRARGV